MRRGRGGEGETGGLGEKSFVAPSPRRPVQPSPNSPSHPLLPITVLSIVLLAIDAAAGVIQLSLNA